MTQTAKNPQNDRLKRWETSFSDLVSRCGSALPNLSQKVINKSVRTILERTVPSEKYNNIEPAVILLVGSNQNSQAVKCLSLGLSQSIATIFEEDQSPIINADNLSKLDLHNELHKVLGSKQLHSVVLDGIERLDGNAALSLHPFTDHDKALYLDVIIVLTAYTDTRITNTSLQVQQIDQIANNLLEFSWGTILPSEQVAGLLSRVTSSVAIVSDTSE